MNKISLIIPVYNAEVFLEETFSKLSNFCKNHEILSQIIFVNDGSLDKTEEILQKLQTIYSNLPIVICGYKQNQGKGYAIKYAAKYLESEVFIVGFTDVELPYGLEALGEVQTKLSKYDILVGSREQNTGKQYSLYRLLMKKIFRIFIPKQVTDFKDTQCGFKFFRSEVFQSIFCKIQTFRWVFDIEIFLLASILDFSIYELPVSIDKKLLKKKGGVSIFKHSLYILKDLFLIKRNLQNKIYEKNI